MTNSERSLTCIKSKSRPARISCNPDYFNSQHKDPRLVTSGQLVPCPSPIRRWDTGRESVTGRLLGASEAGPLRGTK
jgi:hypothetical protein